MKKIIIAAFAVVSSLNVFSQCPNTTGNYEFSITNDARNIVIKARNTTGTIRSSYVNPAINGNFVGLVFGIKWSAQSDIVSVQERFRSPIRNYQFSWYFRKGWFFKCKSVLKIILMNLPSVIEKFMSGEWNVIATIPYSGNLANGDKFELTECGFDETANPYFAQMDMQGNYKLDCTKLNA